MTLCNEHYEQCSCSHLKDRIDTLEQQLAEWVKANDPNGWIGELRDLAKESVGYKQQLAEVLRRLAVANAALNDIASWSEGLEVTSRFDEPGSASRARRALEEM